MTTGCPARVEQMVIDQFDDVLQGLERDEGAAERQDQVEGEQAADSRAEGQRTEPLQPAQVDLAAVVDAVEGDGQLAVGAEQRVADEELARPGQVRPA